MRDDVIVLCWQAPTRSEANALRIAQFTGANVRSVSVGGGSECHRPMTELVPPCVCLIVHVETFVRVADAGGGANGLLGLIRSADHVFVFGFQATDRHRLVLQTLSSHGLVDVGPAPAAGDRFEVAAGQREWCAQFSGLSVGTGGSNGDATFVESPDPSRLTVQIRAGGRPFLVRAHHGSSAIHLSACTELPDLDEAVPSDARPLSWFSRLVPLMMCLRGALGDRLWRSPTPRACFIVDDPLLNDRYGFLDYGELSRAMRGRKFALCVAFIPWNYKRSRGRARDLFSDDPRTYSVCVHGCDHTASEFASSDVQSLAAKASLALRRMRAHQALTGIPFHHVMVFPQGLFTCEALDALKACGYLAAVNSHLCPTNPNRTLVLQDLLDVAMTRFGFPLFGRRYPSDDIADFALDLFLGKPALVVEHHQYFRQGYGNLEVFVSQLNALDERLEWSDLTTICSRACLVKRVDDDIHLRFYSGRFSLDNTEIRSRRYVLSRRWTGAPAQSATLNSQPWVSDIDGDSVTMSFSLDAGHTAAVEVRSVPPAMAAAAKSGSLQTVRVLARRLLCEFRDNYVDTSAVVNGIASGVRQLGSTAAAASAHIREFKAPRRRAL